MDATLLARLQFALTILFHFLFPPLSIGLGWLLVFMEWRGLRDPTWARLGRFFGKLFAITFAVGVASGITMEFQFGMNWASYSRFVGDIFGAPLAAEAVFAFFLESSFLGLYLFGRGRIGPRTRVFAVLMVAVGATISAFWILVANSWQQTPAGFEIQAGRAQLVSFAAAVLNPSTLPRVFHTLVACLISGAFFVGAVSAWWLLKSAHEPLWASAAGRSLRLALFIGFAGALLSLYPTGHLHAAQVARTQPEKFAAIEGLYEGTSGAPLVLFAFPTTPPPTLHAKIELPKLLSWMAFGDPEAPIRGIGDFPADQVPRGAELWLAFVSFHNMVVLGLLFIGASGLGLLLLWRGRLETTRWYLRLLTVLGPLPLLASELGWITAEVGRQPWIVYKLLRTAEAASPAVSSAEVLTSIVLFGLVYLLLGGLWVFLLFRKIAAGPAPEVP